VPNHRIHAPTVVYVPTEIHYQRGYCATVLGGHVTSARGSDHLTVVSARSAKRVTVRVVPGRCPGR
jgi:hypothetical protein